MFCISVIPCLLECARIDTSSSILFMTYLLAASLQCSISDDHSVVLRSESIVWKSSDYITYSFISEYDSRRAFSYK